MPTTNKVVQTFCKEKRAFGVRGVFVCLCTLLLGVMTNAVIFFFGGGGGGGGGGVKRGTERKEAENE